MMKNESADIMAEIHGYKNQIDELLGKKFVDISLIMGVCNLAQSKMHTKILKDCSFYCISSQRGEDIDFKVANDLQALWLNFHYPFIKFMQNQHAMYYNSFADMMYNSSSKGTPIRAVEVRKLSENFKKFLVMISQFYLSIAKYVIEDYRNTLIPSKISNYFGFELSDNASELTSIDSQANFVYLLHRCFSALGDISRHKVNVETSYINPCLSTKAFWRHSQNMKNDIEGTFKNIEPLYKKAMTYYNFCILLLPALNEPYNHIGMIHNTLHKRIDAIYWFLRSRLTRLCNYDVGIKNLNSIMSKPVYLDRLSKTYTKAGKDSLYDSLDHDAMLISLIGYYYLPRVYRAKNGHFSNKAPYKVIEKDFLRSFKDFLETTFKETSNNDLNIGLKQYLILISIYDMIHNDFKEKYLEFVFKCFKNGLLEMKLEDGPHRSNILITTRVFLNWLKENKSVLKKMLSNKQLVDDLARFLNRLAGSMYTNESIGWKSKTRVVNTLSTETRPQRMYYFIEDVALRDYSVINYQLKDFKDDKLFDQNEINLLLGDYSDYIETESFQNMFSDEKEGKKECKIKKPRLALKLDILNEEDLLRFQAIMLLASKILNLEGFEFDMSSGSFAVSEPTVETKSESVKESSKKNSHKKKVTDASPSTLKDRSDKIETQMSSNSGANNQYHREVPSTIKELNRYILNHTSQFNDIISNQSGKNLEADLQNIAEPKKNSDIEMPSTKSDVRSENQIKHSTPGYQSNDAFHVQFLPSGPFAPSNNHPSQAPPMTFPYPYVMAQNSPYLGQVLPSAPNPVGYPHNYPDFYKVPAPQGQPFHVASVFSQPHFQAVPLHTQYPIMSTTGPTSNHATNQDTMNPQFHDTKSNSSQNATQWNT